MDPVTIATAAVAFLAPYLAEGSKAAAKKAGETLVAALERRFKGQPAAGEALQDVKAAPQDGDAQAALRLQLKKALAADPDFLSELARLLEAAQAGTPAVTYRAEARGSGNVIAQGEVAAADHSVATRGDVKGDITITG